MKKTFCIILVLILFILTFNLTACGCKHENLTLIEDTATCENDGVKKYQCDNCNEIIEKFSEKKEHDYSIFINNTATCTANGYKTYKCKNCNSTSKKTSNMLSHSGIGICNNCRKYFNEIIITSLKSKSYYGDYSVGTINYSIDNSSNINVDVTIIYSAPLDQTANIAYKIYTNGTWDYKCQWYTKILTYSYDMYILGSLNLTQISSITKETKSIPVSSYGGDIDKSGLELMKEASTTYFLLIVEDIKVAVKNESGLSVQNFGFNSYI